MGTTSRAAACDDGRAVRESSSRSIPGLVPLLVGVAFCIPALTVGFVFDDLVHRLALEGKLGALSLEWWSLYDFTGGRPASELIEIGVFPWFTSPDLSLRLFRPGSSATLALDHVLFGRHALPAHVHSVLWFGALVATTSALYRRWLPVPVARLASIIYAIAGIHALPTAWLASRHTLVAAVFSVLALWGWARWREDGWRTGVVLTAVALVASSLASEAWLAGLVFLILYEWWTRDDWRTRLAGSAPFLAAGAIYALAYTWLGFGIRGSAMYISPLHDPKSYLVAAATRVPLAFAELFGGLPSILGGVEPAVERFLAGWGIAALLGTAATLFILRSRIEEDARNAVVWLGLASALSPLLLVGTAVTGRVLLVPLVGAAVVVAQALSAAWRILRRGTTRARYLAVVPWLAFGSLHLVVSPLARLGLPLVFGAAAAAHERVAQTADLGPCTTGGRLYLLTAADPSLSLYFGPSIAFYTPERARAERLRVLAIIPQDLRITRLDDRSFVLTVLDLPRRSNDFERLYRSDAQPLEPGLSVVVEELRAEVLETSAGLVTKVRFELDASLDARSTCFIAWRDQRVAPIAMPPVGQSLTVPYQRGPSGL
jgi:hypothetical protein